MCFADKNIDPIFIGVILVGSLIGVVNARIDSILVNRGGARMSIGQIIWWKLKYFPAFLLNCTFKLASMIFMIYSLKFNVIWLYGGLIMFWLLIHILISSYNIFRRYHYLFLGLGMHGLTVAQISGHIRIIDAYSFRNKTTLWIRHLTSKHIRDLRQHT